jgi:hypothetical protein
MQTPSPVTDLLISRGELCWAAIQDLVVQLHKTIDSEFSSTHESTTHESRASVRDSDFSLAAWLGTTITSCPNADKQDNGEFFLVGCWLRW